MSRELKNLSLFLVVYSALAAGILFFPIGIRTGQKMGILVCIFILSMIYLIEIHKAIGGKKLFYFSLLTSLFQVFPDWFLSKVLAVLVFPEDGFPKIGTVSLYMAGLWTIPLFLSARFARMLTEQGVLPRTFIHFTTGIIALIIFWISEETMHLIPVWHAQNVQTIGNSAIYVLPAEFLLGLFFSYTYEQAKDSSLGARILHSASVALFYTGALTISFLLVEKYIFKFH
ncbi:MAG: hypothetical protein O9346_13290 [Leptospiraceae bacterium]|jgi:hypothetical protein|nr:hypothetical protein [Leptospiraceae bacterium]MCZ8347386.1 hypothetical protein [Leptospiraceae bacterium]